MSIHSIRKPRLVQDNGKPLPFEKPKLERTPHRKHVRFALQKFAKHGQAGIVEVSELFPERGGVHRTNICVIRSMVADNINHTGANLQMNTGEQAFSQPRRWGHGCCMDWGARTRTCPVIVVISAHRSLAQGAPLRSLSFLPAAYQGDAGLRI